VEVEVGCGVEKGGGEREGGGLGGGRVQLEKWGRVEGGEGRGRRVKDGVG